MSDSGKNGEKPSIAALKTRPFQRNLALTRLGVSAGTRIAAHEFANLFRGNAARLESDRTFYQEQAATLAHELGSLKGSVMKVGQMLSLYAQYFLPAEAVEVLSGLQDNTPPVDWKSLQPVIAKGLGRARMAELEIDPRPLASASLGQVHRARRRADGIEMVLKVQYPGVADAIESDIRTLSRLISMTRLAPRGLNLEPVYAEVREMLHREVDYLAERDHTERYATLLAADSRYCVPQVFGDFCSDQVLALSYEAGINVRDRAVAALPHARRLALAQSALELFLRELFEWGMVQTDPHFGNYRIRIGADGAGDRLVLLDFGATRLFGRGFIDSYREMLRGALQRDRQAVLRGATGIGLMHEEFPPAVLDAFTGLCELIVEPFGGGPGAPWRTDDGSYDWGSSDLPKRVGAKIARDALSRWFRIPPREIVFLHRRLAGVYILLAALNVKWDARAVLERFTSDVN